MLNEYERQYIIQTAYLNATKSASGTAASIDDVAAISKRLGSTIVSNINAGVDGAGAAIKGLGTKENLKTLGAVAGTGLLGGAGYKVYAAMNKKPFYVKYAPHAALGVGGLIAASAIKNMVSSHNNSQNNYGGGY